MSNWNDAAAREMLFGARRPAERDSSRVNPEWANAGQQAELLERQNDAQTEELATRVSTLRQVFVNIHDEVESQNRMLGDSDTVFGRFGQSMRGTGRRLGRLAESTRGRHRRICQLSLLIVAAFFLLYFYARWTTHSVVDAPAGDGDAV
ncbi:hypothetical protein THASP1DRAFT_27260 [Thamnocephalis sphaerospora]|uniref:t-SNARE coiled-coil homology domain-containing protein n=1 Tax=Thamnocephalis sphaerospora TaxID=78915 RepID=A0A4P9XZ04_9FUNG|nr:hypothetical protein THASP1DRAFT_27260 [Thamnocephalis sphaerospora]|eukprot:RKP10951.1 hypothetical protein THASP1DRAFT_27260 [Thamnocephalis sphaerospora]